MPVEKKINKKNKEEVKIKVEKSSLADFVKRSTPSEEEVQEFEKYVEVSSKDDEMEKSLARIYESEDGEKINIGKLEKKKRLGIFGWFFLLLSIFVVLASSVWAYYNYIFTKSGAANQNVSLSILAPENVLVGEEMVYKIRYNNPGEVALENLAIKVVYPNDFVFIDSYPVAEENNTIWKLDRLESKTSGVIEIKGKIIGEKNKKEILLVSMAWSPENIEAEFSKEEAWQTVVRDTGLNLERNLPISVMAGQPTKLLIKINEQDSNYVKSLNLSIDQKENIEIMQVSANKTEGTDVSYVEKIADNEWHIFGIGDGLEEIKIEFKVLNKINKQESLNLNYEIKNKEESRLFLKDDIYFNVVKNDFNVSLILNGSTSDQGVDFGDTLNYSLIYSNQGEIDVHEVVLMSVLDGDVIDWSTFNSKQGGALRDGTLIWTYKDMPQLKSFKSNDEGIIDFSVNIYSLEDIKSRLNKIANYEITSYSQYSLGFSGTSTPKELKDTRSNIIKVKLNSDLSLKEGVRYFNEDNIAVGKGPIPPEVGKITTYRVYWNLENNLHKLAGLKIKTKLPNYIKWVKGFEPNIGTLKHDSSGNDVIWSIGDLPVSEISGVAEFDIDVIPTENDRGKVMVLLTGTTVEAQDKETNSSIKINTSARTTKLDDDEIAVSDGIVK